MAKSVLIVFIGAALGLADARAQTEPVPVDLQESVDIRLIQVEITVWPGNDDAQMCLGLAAEDFELTVNGKLREIEAVDWTGSAEAIQRVTGVEVDDPERTPVSIVLFFDLWHLDFFALHGFVACPMTKPMVFDEARRMIREQLEPGDRLLLVTFAGWPQVHHRWIEDPEEALLVLDEIEVNPFVLAPRTDHLTEYPWIDGMNSLLLALGRYPGRKELIYLGDDFRFGDISLRMGDLAARAQANRVAISSIDPVQACRGIPCNFGGLECTPFRVPLSLGPISANTGGRLYRDKNISQTVERIREVSGCRYTISFGSTPRDERRANPDVRVRVKKRGLTLRMPVSFQNPGRPPTEREEQDALFLLPIFGQGLSAEVGLWPLKPNGKRKRWNGLLLARIRRTAEPWPEEMDRLVIEVVAHKRSRIYANVRKTITGEALQQLRDSDEPRLLVFPVEGVRPGEATVSLRASGGEGEVAANVRSVMTIPEPPGPGETGPWFLVDRLARAGEQMTMLPALDGTLRVGEPALFVGYGCRGDGVPAPVVGSQVVALKGERSHPAVIDWLDEASAKADGDCGWLAARIEPVLEPGLWRFEPPPVPDAEAEDEDGSILFRVVRRAEGDATPGPKPRCSSVGPGRRSRTAAGTGLPVVPAGSRVPRFGGAARCR